MKSNRQRREFRKILIFWQKSSVSLLKLIFMCEMRIMLTYVHQQNRVDLCYLYHVHSWLTYLCRYTSLQTVVVHKHFKYLRDDLRQVDLQNAENSTDKYMQEIENMYHVSIEFQYKFTMVYCESVNLIGYITVFYLLIENCYASVRIARQV